MLEDVNRFYGFISEPARGDYGTDNFDNQVKNNLDPTKRARLIRLIGVAQRLLSPQSRYVSDEDRKYFTNEDYKDEFAGCFDAKVQTEAEHTSWIWSMGKGIGDKLGVRTPYRDTQKRIHESVAQLSRYVRDAHAKEGKDLGFVDPFQGEYTPTIQLDVLPGYEQDAEAAIARIDALVHELKLGTEGKLAYEAVAAKAKKAVERLPKADGPNQEEDRGRIRQEDVDQYVQLLDVAHVENFAVPARNAMKKALALVEESTDNKVLMTGLPQIFVPFFKAVKQGEGDSLPRDVTVPITIAFLLVNLDRLEDFSKMIDEVNTNYPKEPEFVKGNYGVLFSVLESARDILKRYQNASKDAH